MVDKHRCWPIFLRGMHYVKDEWKAKKVSFGAAVRSLHERLESGFYHLGLFASDHAVAVIISSVLLAAVLSSGMLFINPEDRYERLWAIPESRVAAANSAAAKHFDTIGSPAMVIVTAANEGDNVMSKDVLLDVLALHNALLPVLRPALAHQCPALAGGQDHDRTNATFTSGLDSCLNIHTILKAFNYSRETIVASEDPLQAVLEEFGQAKDSRTPLAVLLSGTGLPIRQNISSSPALRLIYNVDAAHRSDFDFDERFIASVKQFAQAEKRAINSYALGPSSLDREADRAFRSDVYLVALSAVFLLAFSMINVGGMFCFNPIESRAVLALCGIVSVGMAIAASIGLITYCGVLFSLLQVAMMCVVLAIGVDDMYVLVDALARQDPHKVPAVRNRVAGALREVGMSITMTSATDALAFGLAGVDGSPAVESFAINAALAVIFDYAFQVTFFVACMALDEKRIDARRYDLVCCIAAQKSIEERSAVKSSEKRRSDYTTGPTETARHEKFLSTVFRRYYAPIVVESRVFQAGALLTGAVVLAVAAYGVRDVSSEIDFKVSFTKDSFVLPFADLEKKYFDDTAVQVDFVVESPSMSALDLQKTYLQLTDTTVSSSYFYPFAVSWMSAFKQWCVRQQGLKDGFIPEGTFLAWLGEFLSSADGRAFGNDVRYASRTTGEKFIEASRLIAWQKLGDSTSEQISAMSNAQSIAANAASNGEKIHAYSYGYRFLNQIQLIRDRGHITIIVSLAIIAIVTLFFFKGNIFGASLTTFLVAVVNIFVLGFMSLWGVEYNHASHTILVTGTGFSIDYVAHLILAFTKGEGSADGRVQSALEHVGPAIFSGALSTFLGVFSLAFGNVDTSRIFFKLFFLLIVFSAFNGLVISPVLLLLVSQNCEKQCIPKPTCNEPQPDIDRRLSTLVRPSRNSNIFLIPTGPSTILGTPKIEVTSV